MHDVHSVSWQERDTLVKQTREVFTTRDGRILGTETIRHTRHAGWDGTTWQEDSPSTFQFLHIDDAREWISAMYRDQDVRNVKASGGTKLVFLI